MPLCSGPASGGAPLLPTLGALAVKGWRELLARQSDLVAWKAAAAAERCTAATLDVPAGATHAACSEPSAAASPALQAPLPAGSHAVAADEGRRGAALAASRWVESSLFEEILRPPLLAVLGVASRLWMTALNTTEVQGGDELAALLERRAAGQGLLTVSNHVGALDDPLVIAAAMPAALVLRPNALRWTLCATDRCFNRGALADAFFRAAKVLPLERGAGLEQPGLAAAEAKLAQGEWVHMFPEGTRSTDGGRSVGLARRGVGRLYVEAAAQAAARGGTVVSLPLLVPLVHRGMEHINARGRRGLAVGHRLDVLVGEPLNLAPLLEELARRGASREEQYAAVTAAVGQALQALHARLQYIEASAGGKNQPD